MPASAPSAASESVKSKAPASTVVAPATREADQPPVAIYGGPPDTRNDRPPPVKDEDDPAAPLSTKPKPKPMPSPAPAYGIAPQPVPKSTP
jgi:hypothetical protein